MDFGFESLVADWNGVDRSTVNELSEEKVRTRGQENAGTVGRTVEEEEKKPAVGLTSPNQRYSRSSPFYTITCEQPIPHVRDLRPLSSRVHPICFTRADGSTSTVQLLHSSAPSFSYYPNHGTTISW